MSAWILEDRPCPAAPPTVEIDRLDGRFYAADAHPALAWMRENEPVYWDEKTRVWGITRHAHTQEVAKAPQLFCNGQGMRPDSPPIPSMINMDGQLHERRRNLVNRGFTPRRVEELEPKVRRVCVELIERVAPLGRCDFVMDLAAHLPMIMIGDMLGVAPEDREMLRWVTPIQNMARTATGDVEFHGRKIHAGDTLLLLYPSANRDEEVFGEPFLFDIARRPNEHLAFGGYGPHFCLGSSLARLELRVMFEELLVRLPDLELESDAPPPLRPSNFIVGIEHMPLCYAARS